MVVTTARELSACPVRAISLHKSASCGGPLTSPPEMRILVARTVPARSHAGYWGYQWEAATFAIFS